MPRKTSEGGTYSWTRPAAVSKMTKTGCCGGDDGPSLVGACRSEVIGRRRRSPHLGAGTCSEDRWERKPRHGSCSRSCDVAGLGGAAIGPSSLQSRPPCSDAGPGDCECWGERGLEGGPVKPGEECRPRESLLVACIGPAPASVTRQRRPMTCLATTQAISIEPHAAREGQETLDRRCSRL